MSAKRLFIGPTPDQFARAAEQSATGMVKSFTEGHLLANSLEDLVQAVIDDKVPQPIVLNLENHRIDNGILPPASETGDGWAAVYPPAPFLPDGELIQALLFVPYTGTRGAFDHRPSRMPVNMVEASVTDREVILSVVVEPGTSAPVVEQRLLTRELHLVQWVDEVNRDIAVLEQHIRGVVTRQLLARRDVIEKRDEMAAAFTIPVREVEPDRALEIPVRRTTVVLKSTAATPVNGGREWFLADPVYEQMIKTITGFTHALERRPSSALRLLPETETLAGEETLRDWLMFILGSNYEAPDGGELFIGGEVENGKGKTDILVRHKGRNAFIGECKFWHGPKKFDEAIDQLLGYTTWRDTKAAIILFITNKNATAAIDSAGARLAGHPACKESLVPTDPHKRRGYRFASPTDEQRVVSLALLPVVVTKTDPQQARI